MDICKLKYLNYKTSFYKCLNEVKMDCIREWNFISSRFIKFIKLLKEWFWINN